MAVTVSSGANNLSNDNLACTTIRTLRSNLRDILGIPAEASAFVNGAPQGESYMTRDGDQVIFARPTGSKG